MKFYETKMGRQFYDGTMRRLTEALEQSNKQRVWEYREVATLEEVSKLGEAGFRVVHRDAQGGTTTYLMERGKTR